MFSSCSFLYKTFLAKDSFTRKIFSLVKNNRRGVLSTKTIIDGSFITEAFEKESSDCIFVHAGLSRLKTVQGVDNPYLYLLEQLKKHFKTILVPGFTPSFRQSGIFHINYSKPEYGTWSKLFMQNTDYRTYDAIHSILVNGDYDFTGCDYQDSFGKDSCFFKLVKNNVLIANVAVEDFVCTLIHCLEKINNVDYITEDLVEGEIYVNSTEHFHVIQKNYDSCFKYYWDRHKIVLDCKKAGVLRDYSKDGIILYFFNAGDFFDFISRKILNDRYYLLKWGNLL